MRFALVRVQPSHAPGFGRDVRESAGRYDDAAGAFGLLCAAVALPSRPRHWPVVQLTVEERAEIVRTAHAC